MGEVKPLQKILFESDDTGAKDLPDINVIHWSYLISMCCPFGCFLFCSLMCTSFLAVFSAGCYVLYYCRTENVYGHEIFAVFMVGVEP